MKHSFGHSPSSADEETSSVDEKTSCDEETPIDKMTLAAVYCNDFFPL